MRKRLQHDAAFGTKGEICMSMTCQNCHRPLPPGSAFCENCGARVSGPGTNRPNPQNRPNNRRPNNRRRGSGGANPAVIILVIVLALALVAGIVIGIVTLVKKGGKGGKGKNERGEVLRVGEVYDAGDINLFMEDAVFWTKEETFLSPGFKYAQIWIHMENTSDQPVEALPAECFYMYYPDELPQWMKEWQTVYSKDILKKTFGADNRANLTGDPVEPAATLEEDYYDDPITIAPNETASVYLLYQVPEDTDHVSVLYFENKERSLKGMEPNAVFELDVVEVRENQPYDKVWTYDDPVAEAQRQSTYKRPDRGDISSTDARYNDEYDLRDFAERNGKYILQPEALNGGWLVLIHYTDLYKDRYLNGDLQIDPATGEATLTLDWYQLYDEDEKTYRDETGIQNTVFRGFWNSAGTLSVSDGEDTIRILLFTRNNNNGRQEGAGYYEQQGGTDGLPWMITMLRPDRTATDFMSEEVLAELDSQTCYSDLDPLHRNTEPLGMESTEETSEETTETTEETTEPPTEETTAPAETSATDPQQSSGNGDGDVGGMNDAGFPAISTFEHPDIKELMWVANAADAGAPPGATYIDFDDNCKGAWKCRLYYDESTTQLCTVIIDGSDEIRVNIAWYLLWYNGEEPINEESNDNFTFSGYQWGNGIHTEGDGTLGDSTFEIDYFYQIGEYQYAVGTFKTPAGKTATIGMIRP